MLCNYVIPLGVGLMVTAIFAPCMMVVSVLKGEDKVSGAMDFSFAMGTKIFGPTVSLFMQVVICPRKQALLVCGRDFAVGRCVQGFLERC